MVGVPAPGALSLINASIPIPAFTNQTFCDAQVQLAPQQFYPNVYVPTAAELSGNFSAFNGLFVNSANGQPYPNGTIPSGQLANVFAWRIGPAQVSSASQGWSPTGSMSEERGNHAAALLPGGKVLVVSGGDTSADIYDPATGAFTPTARMLFVHGGEPTATLLANGQVLIVGGTTSPSATELYDPSSGKFVSTGTPVQPHGYNHTAALLNDGRVLLVGGLITPGSGGLTTDTNAGAETYNPQTGIFAEAGAMFSNRNLQTETLLADGRVLVAGGYSRGSGAPGSTKFDTAEIYDPSTGTFSSTFPMTEPRAAHFAALLPSGQVLLAGGDFNDASAELFNPATGGFTPTGSMSNGSRSLSTATLLSSGEVLVAGGKNQVTETTSAELYHPATGTFATTGSMVTPRVAFTATLLLDGRPMMTGGFDGNLTLSSAGTLHPHHRRPSHFANRVDLPRRGGQHHRSDANRRRAQQHRHDSLDSFDPHLSRWKLADRNTHQRQ